MAISTPTAAKAVCEMRGWSVSNLALQKILYVAHMVHLGRTQKPLLPEIFEAWDYGPVIPSLYHQVKMFGAGPVQDVFYGARELPEGEEKANLIEVVNFLAPMSPGQLVKMTHWDDGAWAKFYKPGVRGLAIPNEAIFDEFRARQAAAVS